MPRARCGAWHRATLRDTALRYALQDRASAGARRSKQGRASSARSSARTCRATICRARSREELPGAARARTWMISRIACHRPRKVYQEAAHDMEEHAQCIRPRKVSGAAARYHAALPTSRANGRRRGIKGGGTAPKHGTAYCVKPYTSAAPTQPRASSI